MQLGVFELDRPALRIWLETGQAERSGSPDISGWDPLEVGAEREVIELLASAQRRGLLTGPAEVTLIYLDDPEGDMYHVVAALKTANADDGDGDGDVLRLVSTARDWDKIAPGDQSGIEAVVATLDTIVSQANALAHRLERFAAPYEQAAYEKARTECLDVTDGIEAHGTCSCGEPTALYEGRWFHVYNDQLRGTDDHDPEPG